MKKNEFNFEELTKKDISSLKTIYKHYSQQKKSRALVVPAAEITNDALISLICNQAIEKKEAGSYKRSVLQHFEHSNGGTLWSLNVDYKSLDALAVHEGW